MPEKTTKELLAELLDSQITGVLATEKDHQPYANLIAFSYSENLKKIVFATRSDTAKYRNLVDNPQVSMLIDTRKNNREDFTGSAAVTVIGACSELNGDMKIRMIRIHSERLPGLRDFLKSSSIAVFEIKVSKYIITNGLDDSNVIVP